MAFHPLFEATQGKRNVWRLGIAHHGGRTSLDWRRWWWAEDGLAPSRIGVCIPLERLPELRRALLEAGEVPPAPEPSERS
jgi:hypothetical protein